VDDALKIPEQTEIQPASHRASRTTHRCAAFWHRIARVLTAMNRRWAPKMHALKKRTWVSG